MVLPTKGLERLDLEVQELFWLCFAYIDSAETLNESLITENASSSHHQRVVLFLVHQAIEQYYKAILKQKTGRYPKSHILSELQKEVAEVSPQFCLDLPELLSGYFHERPDLFNPMPARLEKTRHEQFRYATRHNGDFWPDIEPMNNKDMATTISKYRTSVMRTWVDLAGWNEDE